MAGISVLTCLGWEVDLLKVIYSIYESSYRSVGFALAFLTTLGLRLDLRILALTNGECLSPLICFLWSTKDWL